jgi:hypothetical protein
MIGDVLGMDGCFSVCDSSIVAAIDSPRISLGRLAQVTLYYLGRLALDSSNFLMQQAFALMPLACQVGP